MRRKPKYLSPTNIDMYRTDRTNWYLNYLAETRPPKIKQTKAMALGSGFDAYVKSYIHTQLGMTEEGYDLEFLFNAQVEPHNRADIHEDAKTVFDNYNRSGALAALMKLLESSKYVRMEYSILDKIDDIPMNGKPDLKFEDKYGNQVILDWKVNGYYSKSNMSPTKNYVICRDTWIDDTKINPAGRKHSRSHNTTHKDCMITFDNNFLIDGSTCLEEIDQKWATQLTIYSWLSGCEVGSHFFVGIDQLVGQPDKQRVSSYRMRVSPQFQHEILALCKKIWEIVEDPESHVFDDLSYEESMIKCRELDDYYKGLEGDTEEDEYLRDMLKR